MSDFDQFWQWVPRRHHGQRDGKGYARQCFDKAVKRAGKEKVLTGVCAWHHATKHLKGSERKMIPHASTWLNRNGWEDYEGDEAPHITAIQEPVQLRYNGVSQDTLVKGRVAQQRLIAIIGEPAYRAWFGRLTLTEPQEGTPEYRADTKFTAVYVRENYAHVIERAWGEPVEVVV